MEIYSTTEAMEIVKENGACNIDGISIIKTTDCKYAIYDESGELIFITKKLGTIMDIMVYNKYLCETRFKLSYRQKSIIIRKTIISLYDMIMVAMFAVLTCSISILLIGTIHWVIKTFQ